MNVKGLVARAALKARKYSPELLVGAGIVGGISAAVWAVRVTQSKKFRDLMDEHECEIATMEQAHENAEKLHYTEEDYKKDKLTENVVYYRTTAKMYWKPAVLGLTSVGCILGGFKIIKSRNVALMAAYSLVDTAFKNYRNRVRGKFGDLVDNELMHDMTTTKSTEKVKNDDGTTSKVESTMQVLNGETVSMYAKILNCDSNQFNKRPEMGHQNWFYVKKKKDYLNDRLQIHGHVFLNEVYDELGINHTQAGSVVGWVKGEGDNYISFGPWSESIVPFEQGKDILVDFNVDGVIWDKI